MTNDQRPLFPILRIFLLLVFMAITPAIGAAQIWTVLAPDFKGDARDPALADVAQLSYRYDKEQDFLWFRVTLYGIPNEHAFGVNLVFDTGSDETVKMNWWGANSSFRFDKLVTAWVIRGNNGYEGTIGVGDATGVKAKQINNLRQNNLQIQVEGDSILIGVKRTDVTDKLKMNLIAVVGSNETWNDDVPNAGSATIDLSAERPKRLREIDLARNNLQFPADYRTLADNQPPLIAKKGHGKQTLILVPGMYSGSKSFDGFIARNQNRYRIYLVTPPGVNGTPARSMPATGPSFEERNWTRRLERDIVDLIRKEKLSAPVIVAERQPGSVAAFDLAIDYPGMLGGIVLTGSNLLTVFPSPKDPTRKTPATLQERATSVNEGLGTKWFKYVTPETWNSNDVPPEMFSNDPAIRLKAWHEIEAAPLQVKIRYLCEFWASDLTHDLDRLQVPVLALIPGFDEKFLADPANGFAKNTIIGSWDLVPKHPKIELMKIPDSRLLVFEDQPKRADDAIASSSNRSTSHH